MSNQKRPAQQFTESDYEVRFASFRESDVSGDETSKLAFYERLAQLGVGGGVHFLRAGSLDKNIDMLVEDFPANEHVREAVIMFDDLVHYYAFDVIRGDIMRIVRDVTVDRNSKVVKTPQTPLHVVGRNEQCTLVTRCLGEQYQRWLGNRVVGLDLMAEEADAVAFLEDTQVFVDDTRIHTMPTVVDYVISNPQ